MEYTEAKSDFDHLDPALVIDLVEAALGRRSTNVCRPLNSYINRVYEVQLVEGESVVAKFYRPGRWSHEALQDELDFVMELQAEELPVIAPLTVGGRALFEHHQMYFAIYPKKGGRVCDEFLEEQWKQLGRLIARVHMVGERHAVRDRMTLHPRHSMQLHLAMILQSGLIQPDLAVSYSEAVQGVADLIAPLFDDIPTIRIHGDCHQQNIIYRPGEGFFVIDFDDMVTGPAIQDIWMLLPGRVQDVRYELELFMDGYETFREFPYEMLKLTEPLRAMRFVHYTAWCVKQAADGGFTRLLPDWGSHQYWKTEIDEMEKQQQEILDALS